MSRPVNNLGISSKREEYSFKKCGSNNNVVECESLKKPRVRNSRMGQGGNRSNLQICIQFQKWGNCAVGEKCRYIHTAGGVASAYGLPSQVTGVEQGNPGKMVACRYFAYGNGCPYGNECQFLHEGGRGEYRESAAITIVTTDGNEGRNKAAHSNAAGNEVRKRTHFDMVEPKRSAEFLRRKLKTKLCNRWERTGSCFYGAYCQFAHGVAELQGVGSSYPQQLGSSAGISTPTKNVASNEIGGSGELYRKRFPFDWTNVYKIAEVYADWIESPPRDQ